MLKQNILVVSRNSYSAITRDGKLVDSLTDKDLFLVYSPRAQVIPPKDVFRELHLVELRQSEEYVAGLASVIHSRYPISKVVSISEQDLLPAAAAREALGLPGMTRKTGELFRDKVQMKEKIRGILKVPDQLDTLADDSLRNFLRKHRKIIIKPKAGYGSQDCYVVDSEKSLEDALSKLSRKTERHFAEQFVDLPIYHFDALVRDGTILFGSLGSYNHPPLDYESSEWLVSTISNEKTATYTTGLTMLEKVIENFAVKDGVFHLEFFADDKETYFGEVAIRPAGGGIADAIHKTWGIHLYEEHVRLQLGLAPSSTQSNYPERYAANMLYYANQAGKLKRIDVLPLKDNSLVKDIHLHAHEGKEVDRARYSGDALFNAVVVADSESDLARSVKSIMENSIVEIEK